MEPELGTSQRVRTVRIKSSAKLEEEMLANIPFKARPLINKVTKSGMKESLNIIMAG